MECFFCRYPLVSDDYKWDLIVLSSFDPTVAAHKDCVLKNEDFWDFDKLEEIEQ